MKPPLFGFDFHNRGYAQSIHNLLFSKKILFYKSVHIFNAERSFLTFESEQ